VYNCYFKLFFFLGIKVFPDPLLPKRLLRASRPFSVYGGSQNQLRARATTNLGPQDRFQSTEDRRISYEPEPPQTLVRDQVWTLLWYFCIYVASSKQCFWRWHILDQLIPQLYSCIFHYVFASKGMVYEFQQATLVCSNLYMYCDCKRSTTIVCYWRCCIIWPINSIEPLTLLLPWHLFS